MDAGGDGTGIGEQQVTALRDNTIAFVRAFGLHRPEATPCGQPLPVSEAHALMELERDGPLSPTELARRLRLEKSTVSRLVGNLEGKGWIGRSRDPDDGRARLLTLTPSGRRTAQRIDAARAARFDGMLRRIPPEERAAVLRALAILANAAQDDVDLRRGGQHAAATPPSPTGRNRADGSGPPEDRMEEA